MRECSAHGVWLKLLCLSIIATLTFEHSALDVRLSEIFYVNGHWLLEKEAQPYVFIFYDAPKALIIILAIYLLLVLIIRYGQSVNLNLLLNNPKFNIFIISLSAREVCYLLTIIILVPTTIAFLKGVTHVSCPNHLTLFGGDLPYITLWQSMVAHTPTKCFPAAHASAGFSLYSFIFLPTLQRYRYRIFVAVTFLGWIMGLYKMLFGDHFFSHTLVFMLLSLTIACIFAPLFFDNSAQKSLTK